MTEIPERRQRIDPKVFLPELEILESELEGPIDWVALFGRRGPVEIDVGCGKGRYLIDAAKAHPETNFLGIEKMGKPYRIAKERIAKRGIPNIRLVKADAREFITDHIADDSVAVVHVLFPDPWPKKRHHKRRVVTPPFVAQVVRILEPGGMFHLSSDIADYYEELVWIVESTGCFQLVEEGEIDPERDILTNFAAKYLAEGRQLHQAWFRLERKEPEPLPDDDAPLPDFP